MCGIFGVYHQDGEPISKTLLENMGKAIAHRGPDDFGLFVDQHVGFGNRRLAIMDPQGGHQPFVSDDGQIVVVQNGEIYNHIELAADLEKSGIHPRTHSDTEVLLHLYQRDGLDFVQQLNGMFAIAIYDRRIETLFLVRDRLGVKPLYFYHNHNQFVFASEVKAILKADVPVALNSNALNHYLTFNYVPLPYTILKDIQHVKPGHIVSIQKKEIVEKKWWALSDIVTEQKSESEWIEEFNSTLADAVRIRLRADVPFGAFLSGGVDSGTIVGLMAKQLEEPVQTFSIGFHDPAFDESPYAQKVAEMFQTNHQMKKVDMNMLDLWPLMIQHCDQPHGDVSFMPTYQVAKLASEHVKMVLTGDGGDELFAGYDKYRQFFRQAESPFPSPVAFQKSYFEQISLFNEAAKKNLLSEEFARQIDEKDSFEVVRPLFEAAAHMDAINQALYLDTMQLLPGNNLVKPDRMGMAVSIEARMPFLDVRMVELAFRMPGSLKLKQGTTKYLYKKAVTPLIGDEIAYRKKQMFTVPIGEWFRQGLSGFVRDKILHGQLIEQNIIRKAEAERMIDQHVNGTSNFTRELRALISLEYWLEIFTN